LIKQATGLHEEKKKRRPHKRHDFRENLQNTKCVFCFSVQPLSETLLIMRKIKPDIIKNVRISASKLPVILHGV
jgi:hypothetical protein